MEFEPKIYCRKKNKMCKLLQFRPLQPSTCHSPMSSPARRVSSSIVGEFFDGCGVSKEDVRRILGTTYHEWLQIYFGRECVIAKNAYLFVILSPVFPTMRPSSCPSRRRWPPRWVR